MMIFDDIDGELDTIETTDKKETIITKKLLPAGSKDCAILIRSKPCTSYWHFRPFV
jgi:hypothetical protein